ncbi:uncharacterized protein BDV17DRAFT_270138 [Aspergillus undulatus]|uniref:uncharacterized protein n=1 Tax=Aspergillus undulatus TaxID=1810928 RepID=UPI003CCDE16A
MAALTMTPPAVRQPFAPLDGSRMRSMLRIKTNFQNKQNGLLSAKRRPLGESDAENIDPTGTTSKSTKRKRALDEDDHDHDHDNAPSKSPSPMKPMKTSRMASTFSILEDPIVPSTPTKSQPTSTPRSAPLKPAGRSPQMKASKPFARRSTVSKNRPESARKGVSRPFSLAAALSGKSSSKSKSKQESAAPAPKMPMPASWSFEIYVDSEQEEMTNLMQHSTCVLDISDDEGKVEEVSDHRGKENIPPADLGLAPSRSTSSSRTQTSHRKSTLESDMVDEPRSPLGELNAADYYGEDYHAFSYAVVYDEDEDATVPVEKKNVFTLARAVHPSRSKLSSMSSIESVLEAASPVKLESEEIKTDLESNGEIEIWESESAAGDEGSEAVAVAVIA